MNYMPEVLAILGVEVGEKFNIKNSAFNPHYFDEDYCIKDKDGDKVNGTYYIETLLKGKDEIEKLAWKPEYRENYFYIIDLHTILLTTWTGTSDDYCRYNNNNVFRTDEEITEEIKQRILREMKGKYEND
jgi:hypothetical protein